MQAALVGASLAVLLTAFVAYGYAFIQHGQSGGFLGWLKTQIVDTAKAAVWLTEQLVPLSSFLLHELGHAFNITYTAAARWIGGVENYIQMKGAAAYNLALALNDWSKWLVNQYIPHLVHGITAPVVKVIHGATVRVTKIERTIVRVPGLTKAAVKAAIAVALPGLIARDLPYFDWLKKHLKSLEKAIAGAAAGSLADVIHWERGIGGRLNRDIAGIRHRIGKLEKLFAGTFGAALVATALARLGLSWVRCSKVGKLGRGLCGAPGHVIDDLLGLVTDFLILTNICQVIPLLEDGFNVVEPLLADFTSGVAASACAAKYVRSPALTVPALQLPASPASLPVLQLP